MPGCLIPTITYYRAALVFIRIWHEKVSGDQDSASANTSHLRTAQRKRRCQRIKQVDKIEELLIRLERLGWRHATLLGFVLVIDLLDLPAIDVPPTRWQDMPCHLVPQARQQPHCCFL